MSKYTDLRIAWLTPGWRFSRAGGLRYWEPLFVEFQQACPGVVFITTGDVHPFYRKLLNICSIGQFRWHKLYASNSGYDRGFALLSPAIIFNLLQLKPDLVISTGFNMWTILAAFLKRIGHWKLIVLLEGTSPTVDAVNNPVRLSMRRWLVKYISIFVTNSIEGKRYLQDYLGVSKECIFRIPHEVPNVETLSMKVDASLIPEDQQQFQFLYVGQLIPRKGVNLLLDAWSRLQSLSSKRTSLWIVGDGVQEQALRGQVYKLGLKNVNFIGQIDYTSLGYWYKSCDVFVFPTLEDTWGMVALEAMAFGKPILCSKYAGAAELVCYGENGFIFDPRNPDKLAEVMLKLTNSSDLVQQFGQKSREVMGSYTVANAVRDFREVIEHVAAEPALRLKGHLGNRYGSDQGLK